MVQPSVGAFVELEHFNRHGPDDQSRNLLVRVDDIPDAAAQNGVRVTGMLVDNVGERVSVDKLYGAEPRITHSKDSRGHYYVLRHPAAKLTFNQHSKWFNCKHGDKQALQRAECEKRKWEDIFAGMRKQYHTAKVCLCASSKCKFEHESEFIHVHKWRVIGASSLTGEFMNVLCQESISGVTEAGLQTQDDRRKRAAFNTRQQSC